MCQLAAYAGAGIATTLDAFQHKWPMPPWSAPASNLGGGDPSANRPRAQATKLGLLQTVQHLIIEFLPLVGLRHMITAASPPSSS